MTVVGLGRSGRGAVRILRQLGARVTVTDEKPGAGLGDLGALGEEVRIRAGGLDREAIVGSETVVLSPGVPLAHPAVAEAAARGVPIIGELELAASRIGAPLIAITGSNGKSTTTSLAGEMLRRAHGTARVFVGGNLGTPLSDAVGGDWRAIVVEVSSFQLETIQGFRPRVAAVLNITPDHLDRYPDFGAYRAAKLRIFENQRRGDEVVINGDDPALRGLSLRARRSSFSRTGKVRRGAWIETDRVWLRLEDKAEAAFRLDDLRLAGAHNVENALAAALIARLVDCPLDAIREAVAEFRGLEHRMEPVRELRGARYINDSKGTNVGAVIKSLEGFPPAGRVILIAGGRGKGADFGALAPAVKGRVRLAILIGEERDRLGRALEGATRIASVPFELSDPDRGVRSLREAVRIAAGEARAGDVVLLSPACASFDLFRDFEDRGRAFKQIVRELS